jgi:ABC-2 type transport system permease protein
MKKFFSLLKTMMSQDMNLFKIKNTKNRSGISKVLIPIALAGTVMFAVGSMYYPFAIELNKVGLVHALLAMGVVFPSILLLIEGVYKSQGILFEAKDSELLFSLPISKKMILLARIIKLYAFQLIYSMMFALPAVAIYCFYKQPGVYFYIISIIMLVLFPIIPTTIACFFGFWSKQIAVNFKHKKAVELVVTFAFLLGMMAFSSNMPSILEVIIENADTFMDAAKTAYFPAGAYMELAENFNLVTLLILFAINAIAVCIFILFASKKYFAVVSKSKTNYAIEHKNEISYDSLSFKPKSVIRSLIKKEFSRYFSSTVYVINTAFGLILLLIATISLCANFESTVNYVASDVVEIDDMNTLLFLAPKIFFVIVIATSFLTSITSSSISMERSSFNISKSLPVPTEKMLLAKVLMSNIISIPVILLCDIIFFSFYSTGIIDVLAILIASFVAPSIASTFGLIVNLAFPKLDASSDTEIVKQSTSSMVAVLSGIFLSGAFLAITFILAAITDYATLMESLVLVLILIVLWAILKKYGNRRYRELEV